MEEGLSQFIKNQMNQLIIVFMFLLEEMQQYKNFIYFIS